MRKKAMTRLAGIEFIDGASHWIQQEQPVRLGRLMLNFLEEVTKNMAP
jgi:pimeloyl-ACP methyl ester carboxylesterase